jgi:hypothetical protein
MVTPHEQHSDTIVTRQKYHSNTGGKSLHAGHYIAYSASDAGAWLKFDDLALP